MEISSQFLSATVIIPDETIEGMVSEIKQRVAEYHASVFNGNVPTQSIDDVIRDVFKKHLGGKSSSKSRSTVIPASPAVSVSSTPDHNPSSVTSAPVDATPTSSKKEFPFDLKKVVSYITDSVHLVESGEICQDVSDILNEDVLKETNGLVNLRLAGSKYGVRVNLHETPQVVALHPMRWSGFVSLKNVETELLAAFSGIYSTEDSTTPLSTTHRHSNRPSGYSQGSYKRVKRGSGQMRCRCHRNSDMLAPMVIDPEIGEFLYENGFTHVALTCTSKDNGMDREFDHDRLNLVFTKEPVPTRAPRLSMTISRLHPYGQNKAAGKTSTYCLGSDTFNRSILKHFNQTCKGLEERLFNIRQTGPEKNGKIGYEITSVTA